MQLVSSNGTSLRASRARTVFGCICFRSDSAQDCVVEVWNGREGDVLLRASISVVCGLVSIETAEVNLRLTSKATEHQATHKDG